MATPDAVIRVLLRGIALLLGDLDPEVRERLEAIYRDLRRGYTLAPSAAARDAALQLAIAQFAGVPQVRELVDRARGADASFVGELWLPDELVELAPRAAMAPPPPAAEARTRGSKKKGSPKRSVKKNGGGAHAARPTAANGGGGAGAAPPEQAPTLRRYPEVAAPQQAAVGQKVAVTVWLRMEATDAEAVAMIIEDVGVEPPSLEVVLYAKDCAIAEKRKPLVVDRENDAHADFELTPQSDGVVVVRADFYQAGRLLGTAATGMVVGASQAVPPPHGSFALDLRAGPVALPDLHVIIRRDPRDERVFSFELTSEIEAVGHSHDDKLGSITIEGDPVDQFNETYSELTKYADTTPPGEAAARQARIDSLGRDLWDRLFSPEMKAAYWEWKDVVRSIQITSDEPWIPWEMVKPHRSDAQGKRIDDGFLCERFTLSRWLRGMGPADHIAISDLQAVASKNTDLASVGLEVRAFRDLIVQHPQLRAAPDLGERAKVIAALTTGGFSILHVATHGDFDQTDPDSSGITLTDGRLIANDVAARFGGAKPRPIVFLNACHGGRLGYTLTGLGGWADRFVADSHVGAFVGAAWEVNDDLALTFADRFYNALLGGKRSIGEAMRDARQAIRDEAPGNSTWLAYVLYSDPTAGVRIGGN